MKIAVLGDETSISGFKAFGIDTFAVPRSGEAAETWKAVAPEEYSVIFITEPAYRELTEQLAPLRGQVYPVVSIIPSVAGSGRAGRDELRALVEKAVGTDVMFREE